MYKRLTPALICAGIFWAGASVAEPHLVFSEKVSVKGSGGLSALHLTEEILLTTGQLSHSNLEGISVWVDPKCATRVTMISDDNFLPVLRSEVVEYVLHE